jgi:hypothetical protein
MAVEVGTQRTQHSHITRFPAIANHVCLVPPSLSVIHHSFPPSVLDLPVLLLVAQLATYFYQITVG